MNLPVPPAALIDPKVAASAYLLTIGTKARLLVENVPQEMNETSSRRLSSSSYHIIANDEHDMSTRLRLLILKGVTEEYEVLRWTEREDRMRCFLMQLTDRRGIDVEKICRGGAETRVIKLRMTRGMLIWRSKYSVEKSFFLGKVNISVWPTRTDESEAILSQSSAMHAAKAPILRLTNESRILDLRFFHSYQADLFQEYISKHCDSELPPASAS